MAYRRCQEEVQKLPAYVSSFTLSLGKRLISLVIDNTEKSLTILKLQKDDYIPRSLKSAVKLSGSDEVSRTQTFTTLASSFNTTTTEYIASAKKLMVDAALLERNVRSKKIFEEFLKICLYSYQLSIVELGTPNTPTDTYDNDSLLLFALTTSVIFQSASFLENLNMLKIELSGEEQATICSKVFPGANDPLFNNYKSSFDVTHDTFLAFVKYTQDFVNNLIFLPLQAYSLQVDVIKKEAIRREFIAKQQALTKADAITMLVDSEPTTSPQLLRSLVHKEVLKELNKLQSTLINRPKNTRRGANANTNTNSNQNSSSTKGASLKKKSIQQRSQTPTRRNRSQQRNSSSKQSGAKTSTTSAKTTKQPTVDSRDNVGKRDNSKKKKNDAAKKRLK